MAGRSRCWQVGASEFCSIVDGRRSSINKSPEKPEVNDEKSEVED